MYLFYLYGYLLLNDDLDFEVFFYYYFSTSIFVYIN